MGCLIFSILGLLIGFFLFTVGAQPDYGEFNQLTFYRFSGIILIAVCCIYLLVKLVGMIVRDIKAAETQAPPPVKPLEQQPPPQSRSRGGVFLPQALPEQQGRNKPRQEER